MTEVLIDDGIVLADQQLEVGDEIQINDMEFDEEEMIVQEHDASQTNESETEAEELQQSDASETSGNETEAELQQSSKNKRKSYNHEMKLEAIKYFSKCSNKYKTAKKFGITPATLRGWIKNEALIKKSCRGTRKVGSGRKAFWPDMEKELFSQYLRFTKEGPQGKVMVV